MFSWMILLSIIVNCGFMTISKQPEYVEYEYTITTIIFQHHLNDYKFNCAPNDLLDRIFFTCIYTMEAVLKAVSRGMILHDFTYLRDVWNWLDFVVVGLAYAQLCRNPSSFPIANLFGDVLSFSSINSTITNPLCSDLPACRYMMFAIPFLGNMSALKSLRVLRALKTVTVARGVPYYSNVVVQYVICQSLRLLCSRLLELDWTGLVWTSRVKGAFGVLDTQALRKARERSGRGRVASDRATTGIARLRLCGCFACARMESRTRRVGK